MLPNGVRLSCGAELERSQTEDYPRNRGAVSFRRVLGGGENAPPNAGREFDNGKEGGRIKIILTGLIDHPKLAKLLCVPIGNNLVQFPALEGSFVASVPQTENELPRTRCHISQDNA